MSSEARRVTVYLALDGWRYKAQAANWRTIGASEEGKTRKKTVIDQATRRYPGAELVIKE